uniref:Uncharacterized protein n=1 Tax=Trichogramma kaykai TaxID=54128 RepID=A0ABD2WJX8_9HYME
MVLCCVYIIAQALGLTRFENEAVKNRKEELVNFVVCSGYRDEPELNEDGKPSSLRRTTALHLADGLELFYIVPVTVDESGYLHFHVACKYGLDDVVKEFLELGQDPNCIVPETRDSPLHLVLNQNFRVKKLMELLLRHGADPNSANKEGLTPLHVICEDFNSGLIKAFFEITDANHLTIQIDAKDKLGRTPLQLAVASLSLDVVDVLLNRGANLNFACKEGLTPLHLICEKCENVQLIKTFFEIIDANHLTIEIDAKDKLGRTPLQLAVVRLFPDIVDVILDHGADLLSFVFPTENYLACDMIMLVGHI